MEFWHTNLWSKLLNLIFPKTCLGCKSEGTFLCQKCFNTIERTERQVCPECLSISLYGFLCTACRTENTALDGLLVACHFARNSVLRDCIHALKYQFVQELADPLARILFQTWREWIDSNFSDSKNGEHPAIGPPFLLCPVPLHLKRKRFRGFNQAELLAEKFVMQAGSHFELITCLKRCSFARPQMELSREERLRNVKGAFIIEEKWKTKIRDAVIILVDDVATTTTTLQECAKVLKTHGAKIVYGLVIARGG